MKRRTHTAAFKSRVAVEAIRGEQTISQIASRFAVHPSQVTAWKKPALEGLEVIFSKRRGVARPAEAPRREELYAQMGRLQMEGPWLKKSGSAAPFGPPGNGGPRYAEPSASVCPLGSAAFDVVLYAGEETSLNRARMRLIDERYTICPM